MDSFLITLESKLKEICAIGPYRITQTKIYRPHPMLQHIVSDGSTHTVWLSPNPPKEGVRLAS